MKRFEFLLVTFFLLTTRFSYAGSATWNANATSNDWNTADNRSPETIRSGQSLPISTDPSVAFDLVAEFQYPRAVATAARGLNDNGDVSGIFVDDAGRFAGFVRYQDGSFSAPVVEPSALRGGTFVWDVSNTSILCGSYVGSDFNQRGFLLSGGIFSEFEVMGMQHTYVSGVNDAGDVCGSTSPAAAFVIIGGRTTTFNVPGALYAVASKINNLQQTVGWYNTRSAYRGFRREADGKLMFPIDAPGATHTYLNGVSDSGLMVGTADNSTGSEYGVFFATPRKAARYAYPDAIYTSLEDVNDRGLICGWYYTAENGNSRSIVVRATVSP